MTVRLLFWRARPVAVLELHGTLSARPGALNIRSFGPLIDSAMAATRRGGTLVLDIDSPGGSPVQSELIAARLRARAAEREVRLVAVIGEVGASGGYWLACAAEDIVASPMSIVGSIGVVGGGFGFPEALSRLGVERRLYTAGTNKARLDPFSPKRPQDVAFVNAVMAQLHERFKAWVRERRGARLRVAEAELFDGGWMLGERAVAVGLVDRLGALDDVVREIGGARARSRVIRPRRRGMLSRLPRLMADALIEAAERASLPRL